MYETRMHLYRISADGGNTWTEQWLTDEEANDERKCYICELKQNRYLVVKNMKIYTNNYSLRQMEYSEIKELEIGDKVAICISNNFPDKMEFVSATVARPLFWNSDADEPDWEIETTNGFVDIYSIYEMKLI